MNPRAKITQLAKVEGQRLEKNLEEMRRNLVRAVAAGVHPEGAAISLGVARSTAFGWLKMARDGGLEALAVRKAPGAEPKLTEAQLDQLVRWLVGKNPRQLQFDFALWTRKMVGELIEREFGITYIPQGIGKLLTRLGFSPQRPLVRAHQEECLAFSISSSESGGRVVDVPFCAGGHNGNRATMYDQYIAGHFTV
jgi:transposase